MMRVKNLFGADIRFQAKYGFYFLYGVLTVVYIAVLLALPRSLREKAAAVFIFSDPAAMGRKHIALSASGTYSIRSVDLGIVETVPV